MGWSRDLALNVGNLEGQAPHRAQLELKEFSVND